MTPPIRGLSAFPITPADAAGRIDTDALQGLLGRLIEAGVDSIGLLGSTGSYPYFTRAERRRAVAAAAECVAGRVPLLVGVGALRTEEVRDLARDAREAGADAGLLAPVSYAPLQDGEVHALFEEAARTGLPLCIYNNPATTHFTFTTDLVARIAALPGVLGVKNPAPSAGEAPGAVAGWRAAFPPGFVVGVSVDWNAPAALLAGADAWFSVIGGTFPVTAVRLTRAAQAGEEAAVRTQEAALEPLWAVFRRFSSYRVVHHVAARGGMSALPPRPVLPLAPEAAREVDALLERLDLA